MSARAFAPFIWLFVPAFLLAGNPYVDISKADVDGPHVFYRGKNIVVKSVLKRDTTLSLKTQTFTDKNAVTLVCNIPSTRDVFSFPLQKKLKVDPETYSMPKKLLALSDIEGNFGAFKTMLQGAYVIDEDFNWIYGDGHLVLVGDFFDRGLNVTECLWLIYKLEEEAEAVGGKVHFILGNHEILNLAGYYNYTRKKYLENARIMGEDYGRWYDDKSELGRWLRTKNAVEKIGDYVFCHGAISPELAASGLSLSDINRITRQNIGTPEEDLVSPEAQLVFHSRIGIFWYREAAKNKLSEQQIDDILTYAGAKRMVVGHTLMPDITALYNGKLICIDLFHDENVRQGAMRTLYIEDGLCYSLDARGIKSSVYTVMCATKTE